MDLPPLRAAALAVTAVLAIPCSVAQAQGTDLAAPDAGQPPPATATTTADGSAVSTGTQTLAVAADSSSGGATQAPAPAQQAAPPPSEPIPTPQPEPTATPQAPPPQPAPQEAAPPPTGDATRTDAQPRTADGSGPAALPPARDPAPSAVADSAATSAATPTAVRSPQDPSGGAPNPPDIRPEPTEVDRLLPALDGKTRPPTDGHRAPIQLRQGREIPLPHGHSIRLDPYAWVHSPAHASPRVVTGSVERKPHTPPASGSGGHGGGPDQPAPSSPAPGSASASPGGGFFAAGLASLAAILIGLALPHLRARLELPPRGRCTVAFLRPLERPG
jgi:hypothetical protein